MKCFLPAIIVLLIYNSASAQLNADFSAVNTQGCLPLSVRFQDNSTGSPTEWFWDFGNGITSTDENPSVIYTQSGNYSVRLIVRTATEQAYETKTNFITVYSTPKVNFLVSSGDSGCIPLQSVFKDASDVFNISVKSWLWDFGDGATSSLQNPTHSFTAAGKYNVSLTVETTQGCSGEITQNAIVKAGNNPVADFSATPLDGCASTLRNFKNKSTGSITGYTWNFGDGGISYDKNPAYHYQDTGTFNVKLTVSENGCKDSAEFLNYIHVDGPVAKFSPNFNCADRYTILFRDKSIGETGRLWDFGDGQTSSLGPSIYHTYASKGIYPVMLIVTGITCSDTAYNTLHIQTSTPKIAITPEQNLYCRNTPLLFSVTDFDSVDTNLFSWDFGDGTVTNYSSKGNPMNHVYLQNGKYTTIAYIRYLSNCVDTISSVPFVINGPTAQFSEPANGCINSAANFKDESIAGQDAPINQRLWSFGDGTTSNSSGAAFNYIYAFPGNYTVNFKVTDVNGCFDSIMHTIDVFSSPTVDAGADTFACANSNLTLNPNGADSYVWLANPDLSCTTCTNPVATPQQSTTYFVTGTTDGCSASDSLNITVQTKELITTQPNSYSICAGDSVMLNVTGADNYSWAPPNALNNSTISNPIAFPVTNTTYTVTGKDNNNCFSDMAVVNVIVNPSPTVNIIDSTVQLLTGSTFTIAATASGDAQSPEWSPASGLSCYTCLQPVATVGKTTIYTLKVSNQYGCSDSDKITITSVCTNESVFLPNTFSPNNDGMNDYFFPRTPSDINIMSLTVFNRWGQIVFQKRNFSSNNALNGWDGKYKNVLQNPDVYVYVMELQCSGRSLFLKRGDITLLR